jgi:oligopeptide/dipeptide ABC transporter ATP-binding protein
MSNANPLLRVKDLVVEYTSGRSIFRTRRNPVRILQRLNLDVIKGETLAVVGESGCGKTTLANAIAAFVPARSGEILFEGRNVLALDAAGLRSYRREMQMVFQNPFSSLDPRMRVGSIVAEPLRTHTNLARQSRESRVERLLIETGLSSDHAERYPHELSGGQAQRVALARAIALNPKLLLLDEPTSALDVSVQAHILNLLRKLQQDHGLTYIVITHNIQVVHHVSDRVVVLYLGEIVEEGPRLSVFMQPSHPYTQALFAATPIPDPSRRRHFVALRGSVPSPANPPAGCRFHTRCPHAMTVCQEQAPPRIEVDRGHWAACHLLKGPRESFEAWSTSRNHLKFGST